MTGKKFIDFAEAIEHHFISKNPESIKNVSTQLEEMIQKQIKEEVMKQFQEKDTIYKRYEVELGVLLYNILSGIVVVLLVGFILYTLPETQNKPMNKREFAW